MNIISKIFATLFKTKKSDYPYGPDGKHKCSFVGQPIVKSDLGNKIRQCAHKGCYFISITDDEGNFL